MRVMVIGGTRFIGLETVTRLHALGHEVVVFHRGQTAAALPRNVQEILGDRYHLADRAGQLKDLAPDVVLDMIPLGEEDTRAVVRVFTGVARRIVAISSQDVFRAYGRLHETEIGPPEETPLTEDAPLRERFFPYRDAATDTDDPRYRYEKILVEREIMGNSDLPGTVLRLPAVYGRRDPQHRLFPYLKRMDDKRPGIILDEILARWRWSRIYVENAASAITLAVTDDRAAGRVYNIAEPEALTEAEWIRQIGLAAGWSGEVVIVPEDHLPTHLQRKWDARQHSVADSTRIRHEMGYREHVPLSEGLHRTIAWERAHLPDQANWPEFDYAAEDEALSPHRTMSSNWDTTTLG